MTTNTQIIEWALQEIYVLPQGQSADGTQLQDGLDALNRMMAMWAMEDKDLNFPPQDTAGATTPIPIWAEEAVITNLAVNMASVYQVQIPPLLAIRASRGEQMVGNVLINLNLEKADMSHLPQGTGRYRYDINTDN